ncbi:hypothetical protein RRG08_024700 [Elysia crispata]|uniref:Uncharacterized protein n=1 Tax=Elysia crispata TaxID=231223 RepID=A0AAE1CWP1_9GAST|nr:hypothetical protein RRG08_024700 [Elysia crispata]
MNDGDNVVLDDDDDEDDDDDDDHKSRADVTTSDNFFGKRAKQEMGKEQRAGEGQNSIKKATKIGRFFPSLAITVEQM